MPNWVCNHLIIHGENAVEVMNSLLSENSESENGYDVDFNKIIPMPEDLRIESGSVTRDCAKLYVNAMLEGCDAYKKCAALYVQAFGKDIAMSEDEQIKTMEYVMLHKDYEKNCPLFQRQLRKAFLAAENTFIRQLWLQSLRCEGFNVGNIADTSSLVDFYMRDHAEYSVPKRMQFMNDDELVNSVWDNINKPDVVLCQTHCADEAENRRVGERRRRPQLQTLHDVP